MTGTTYFIEQYTIYDHPLDFPDWFVVRKWLISSKLGLIPGDTTWICETVDEAREMIRDAYPGAYPIGRRPDDDPTIVEVWT